MTFDEAVEAEKAELAAKDQTAVEEKPEAAEAPELQIETADDEIEDAQPRRRPKKGAKRSKQEPDPMEAAGSSDTVTEQPAPAASPVAGDDELEPEPPAKAKYRVSGKDVELTKEEVEAKLNREELARISHQRLAEADQKSKAAAKEVQAARQAMEALEFDGPNILVDRLTARFRGDYERARRQVAQMCADFLEPILKEEKLSPAEQRERAIYRHNQREAQRIQTEWQRLDAELALRTEREQREEQSRAETDFQEQVVDIVEAQGIPNDAFTEFLYYKAKELTAENGLEWTPQLAAKIIAKQRAKENPGAKPSRPRQNGMDKIREAQAARSQAAEARREANPPGSPSPQRAKSYNWDDVRERLGF